MLVLVVVRFLEGERIIIYFIKVLEFISVYKSFSFLCFKYLLGWVLFLFMDRFDFFGLRWFFIFVLILLVWFNY